MLMSQARILNPNISACNHLEGSKPVTTIGIVGTGPSGIYSLMHLISLPVQLHITMFEQNHRAGVGTPYDPETNDPAMLANIASIELPPVTEALVDWLVTRTDDELSEIHINRAEICDRAFYPRVLIGAYYHDQLNKLVELATSQGHAVEILTRHHVVDVIVHESDVVIQVEADGATRLQAFDFAIVASGHQERDVDEEHEQLDHAYAKRDVGTWRDARIGVLGTSLSAIDVAIGTAAEAGRFIRQNGRLSYVTDDPAASFSVTLMSRRGLLPEADFYCPIPYEPLIHCTPEQVIAICNDGRGECLDRLFALFKTKLASADPGYADGIGLQFLTPDNFAEVYFAARQRVPTLDWAEANLAEAKANARARKTVAWRYAILRMHEVFGNAVKFLDERDRKRFSKGLKQVFIDNYAAVPPLSIERLLALRDDGRLRILRLGNDYSLLMSNETGTTHIQTDGGSEEFDIMVDARGQPALTLQELPFPTLRLQIIANERVNDPSFSADDVSDLLEASVDVDESFALNDGLYSLSRVYCLSIPHLLKMHPFIQGLTSCNELARAMTDSLAKALSMLHTHPHSGMSEKVAHFDKTSLVFCLSKKQWNAVGEQVA
jgi:uncharacterized NAD(P)/FAD-binding protein YdhS